MPWMIPETRLDDDQKTFINEHLRRSNSNIWIKGHAGSGKSVLLVHGLRDKLIENRELKVAVVVFTRSLIDLLKSGIEELNIENEFHVRIPIMTYYNFIRSHDNYDIIFVDEVQDLTRRVLEAMKSRSKRIIVAGDQQQSIYEEDPQYQETTVSQADIAEILDSQAFELPTIYRLTRSIIRMIANVFGDFLNARRDATKVNVDVQLGYTNTAVNEVRYVWNEAKHYANTDTTALLFPHVDYIIDFANEILRLESKPTWQLVRNDYGRPDYGMFNSHFRQHNIRLEIVGNGYGSLETAYRNNRVVLMTYHSAKGLDFENVFLPRLSINENVPSDNPRVLLMVALTRSRKNLYITHTGRRNPVLAPFTAGINDFNIDEVLDDSIEKPIYNDLPF